ncbi:MAG: phenyltransferase domain-containing protein [Desulfobacterales bacterium]|jgi:hypothetical protein
MTLSGITRKQPRQIDIQAVCDFIAGIQKPDGEIPWCEGQKTDPWDHVESAMGLTVGGRFAEARLAYEWMRRHQRPDGSWYAAYRLGEPEDRTLDANMSSYIAVGAFHYYRVTGDVAFLQAMWDTVRRAIEFALKLQTVEGPIYWAVSPEGRVDPMALLTGSCSIYMSLKCAIETAERLGHPSEQWRNAAGRLVRSIQRKRHLFNMTKSRFSMDWFYPVLSGALTGAEARRRLESYWRKFVVEGQGVRCVFDEPWVTVAETCELVLALAALGNDALARVVFGWIADKRYEDGSFWCGHTVPDTVIWPEDRLSWTNAAVLMAADALFQLTPASDLFTHAYWAGKGMA